MRARGFTLIEVVIAMFIAAIMFAIGYGAINQALVDRDALNVSQARVTEIQRGMRVVAQDFAQIGGARRARHFRHRPARGRAMSADGAQQQHPHVLAQWLEQSRGRRSAPPNSACDTASSTARWCASTGWRSIRRSTPSRASACCSRG